MNTAVQPVEEEQAPRKTCPTCGGTGLVCGHVPVIDSQNCCTDFANALCPNCNGRGTVADG